MSVLLYPELDLNSREDKLRTVCNKKEMRTYGHTLQQPEVDVEQQRYAVDGIELKKQEEELKNVSEGYKAKIKEIKDRMAERLEKIEFRKRQVSGILYGIVNDEENRMMWYDKYGELIESRDLLPDERKGPLFSQTPEGKAEFANNPGGKPGEQTIDVTHQVIKDDPKQLGPGGAAGADGDGKEALTEQQKMDIEQPLNLEQLTLASKHRILTPDEQQLLQSLNADSKKVAKKTAAAKK